MRVRVRAVLARTREHRSQQSCASTALPCAAPTTYLLLHCRLAQLLMTTTQVTFTAGGFAVGFVADSCFVRRQKSLLLIVVVLCVVTYAGSTVRSLGGGGGARGIG